MHGGLWPWVACGWQGPVTRTMASLGKGNTTSACERTTDVEAGAVGADDVGLQVSRATPGGWAANRRVLRGIGGTTCAQWWRCSGWPAGLRSGGSTATGGSSVDDAGDASGAPVAERARERAGVGCGCRGVHMWTTQGLCTARADPVLTGRPGHVWALCKSARLGLEAWHVTGVRHSLWLRCARAGGTTLGSTGSTAWWAAARAVADASDRGHGV